MGVTKNVEINPKLQAHLVKAVLDIMRDAWSAGFVAGLLEGHVVDDETLNSLHDSIINKGK